MGKGNKRKTHTTKFDLLRESRKQAFIEKALKLYGDQYDYSLMEYKNVDTKVRIRCNWCSNDLMVAPYWHLNGRICLTCKVIEQRNSKLSLFIEQSQLLHGNKFDYSKAVYRHCDEKITIGCNTCKSEFEQSPYQHLRTGGNCPHCSFVRTYDAFIKKAQEIHSDLYDYSQVVFPEKRSPNDKVKIICKAEGHIFWQSISNHLFSENGCRKCNYRLSGLQRRKVKSTDHFIELAKKVHGNLYDYSKTVFIDHKTMVLIYCPRHNHEFYQIPSSHLTGAKCGKCIGLTKRRTNENYIEICSIVHNNKYSYDRTIYDGVDKKVEIECSIHGYFWQIASLHIGGCNCPQCVFSNISVMERRWLDHCGIEEKFRQIFLPNLGRKRFDGYDPSTKTVYEFNGDFWHGNPNAYKASDVNKRNGVTFGELYARTIAREDLIRQHYNLISIWESDWCSQWRKICRDIKNSIEVKIDE